MDQTQNTSPQPPKKSFWAKLFGGGKADQTPPTPSEAPSEPASQVNPPADLPVSVPPSDPTPPVPPTQAWSMPNPSPTTTAPASPDPVAPADSTGSATEPAVAPVPSWRDTPATTPTDDVPVPPSDPMVTPVQPVEAPEQPSHDDTVGGDRPSITPPER